MKYFPKLIGSRIYLSPMCIDDAPIYVKWLNNKLVSENVGLDGKTITLESEVKWIRKNQNKYYFAIVLKENNELVGNIGFNNVDLIHRSAALNIIIGEEENVVRDMVRKL